MKLFLDTNVILDIILRWEPFFSDSYHAVRDCQELHEFCFSASSATDIYYLLRKALGREAAGSALNSIVQLFTCIDTQKGDIINALASEMSDFEDAVVSSMAARIKADYIITRNTREFFLSEIPALSPSDFIAFMQK